MNPTIHRPAARLALALGLVAGAWLILSAFVPGQAPLLAGSAPAATEPDRIIVAQADAVPVARPVSYSSDQADRGRKRFESSCAECHGDDLKGGINGGPPLHGSAFEEKYANGAPASGLFMFMSTLMPPDFPGRFSPSVYADLMAYVLKRNGFPDGAPLPSDVDALDHLIIEK
jgi:mono/diheme cytochrome c family protein